MRPKIVQLPNSNTGTGWIEWHGIANIEGYIAHRERITSLYVAPNDSVWVGTSHGRLLRFADDVWTLEAELPGLQITGMAEAEGDVVWLSTSNGITRLQRPKEASIGAPNEWVVESFRYYYEGSPGFVSGSYTPGEDAQRLWGYVDDIFIPTQMTAYKPMVVSTEHGLFTWGGYGGVWHHFLPHFWGANSDWLDTRELIPHRRPTCIAETKEGDLWIGTEGDGIVRINAAARRFYLRDSDDNEKDGQEFTYFTAQEVGAEFSRVNDISIGLQGDVWAAFVGKDKQRFVGHYRDQSWSLCDLPTRKRNSYQKGVLTKTETWQPTAICIAEVSPGRVYLGIDDSASNSGMLALSWEEQTFQALKGIDHAVRDIKRTNDGTIWAQTWWNLYSQPRED